MCHARDAADRADCAEGDQVAMAKNVMPKSKAKTAYGLLSEIRKLILEEPRRYDQTAWKRTMSEVPQNLRSHCGAVCCVAGWVDTLKSEQPVTPERAPFETADNGRYRVSENAQSILGISEQQADELFDGEKAGERYTRNGGVRVYHLRNHAKRGATHIARFQTKYAAQLKAKRV